MISGDDWGFAVQVRFLAIIAMLSFLSGCNTTEQANVMLEEQFQGTQVDRFFKRYGPPVRSFRTQDGDTIYIWMETPQNHYVPPTAVTTVNTYGTTSFANTDFFGGGAYTVQCQLKVIADRRGVIKDIVSHKDTVGNLDLSRCHEVFRKPKNKT